MAHANQARPSTKKRVLVLGVGAACALGLGFAAPVLVGCNKTQPEQTQAEQPVAQKPANNELDEHGLGKKFTYEVPTPYNYDPSVVDLTPNANSAIAGSSQDKVVYNGIHFNFDTASGATPRYVREETPFKVDQNIKDQRMIWTVQPPLGITEGEFYRAEKEFNNGYIATTELVINDGKIVHVEMNERGPADYYDAYWADQTKRRSGYGFFQALSPRTHETLMVTPNAFNFLEWQLMQYQSLNMPLQGVRGISNSARDAFIPSIEELNKAIETPSGKYYLSIALPLEQGLVGRLELFMAGDTIEDVRYDEIFADRKDDIPQEDLKKYVRQSKLESVDYNKETDQAFRKLGAALKEAIVAQNGLDNISLPAYADTPEYKHALDLAAKLAPALADYRAKGYTHNIGTLTQTPENMPEITPIYYRTDQLEVHYSKATFDPESKTVTVTADVTNVDDKPVTVLSDWFFLYVSIGNDKYENVGDPNKQQIDLKAGEKTTMTFKFFPVYKEDGVATFKYDGPLKIYEEIGQPKDLPRE